MRGRNVARIAAITQAVLLAGALIVPSVVAAATFGFTLNTPTLSTLQYSDFTTLRGTYTCINDGVSNCPTTASSRTATFYVRLSGDSTWLSVGTVTNSFAFPSSCSSTCSFNFSLAWKAGRALTITTPPGVYDLRLTTTIAAGEQILLNAITVTRESTTTAYTGATSGQGDTDLALAANVVDADMGLSTGTGIYSPDANLLGTGLMTFELFDSTNTTSVAGPVSATVLGSGNTSGSPVLHLPSSGGTFKLRTTFVGNSFYTTSSDLDTVTVAASNTPPVLTVPASPVLTEASSPSGAYRTFTVSATDAEDVPAPTPTCDHASGDLFPIGDTLVSCSVTDSGGLSDSDSFTIRVVDTTDPVMSIQTSESDNGAGWYNAESNDGTPGVTVDAVTSDLVGVTSLACTDNGSDIGALNPSGDTFVIGDGSHAISCTATDGAGNHHSDGATFDVDQTAPQIAASVTPDAAGSGWWNIATGAPTVTYSCSDDGSGLASCSGPHTFGEGANQGDTGTATDVAGNSATASVTVDVDLTAPSISASVSPDAAGSGWWNASTGAPTVTYSCSDDGSGVASCTSPHEFGEGADQGDTGTAVDAAGNSATASVSGIDVDLTAPSIAASVSPDASASGWWNIATGAPTVTYACGDTGGSGLASCSDPHLFGEGADQGDTGTAMDVAGNSATASVSGIDVDLTAPSISASISPFAAGSGWWSIATGGPTVTYTCSDGGSGVATCSDPHPFGEGAGQGDTGTAVDVAGNSSTASVSGVNVDLTAPSISAALSPAASSSGWWNASTGAPTVTYTCGDTGSGLASCSSAYVFGEGADQGATGSAADVAGNTNSASVSNVDVDLAAPTGITFVGGGLTNGGSYIFGFVPAGPTGCSANGGTSGLAGCLVGGYWTAVGTHVVTATATDNAGNTASATLTYTVQPWTLVGFANPISMTGFNAVKAGSSQNLKFQVFAGSTELTSLDVIAAFTQTQISCTTLDAIGPTTSALLAKGASLRYTSSFVAKWDPPATANTCWSVAIVTADGSSLRALFQLK